MYSVKTNRSDRYYPLIESDFKTLPANIFFPCFPTNDGDDVAQPPNRIVFTACFPLLSLALSFTLSLCSRRAPIYPVPHAVFIKLFKNHATPRGRTSADQRRVRYRYFHGVVVNKTHAK